MSTLTIRNYTDPACPWAFSAEPARWRLRWLYGDGIEWQPRMVVLSERPEDYLAKDFTPARQAEALRAIQRRFGMPIDARERPRMLATVVACRAVVAARVGSGRREERALLRRLQVAGMAGELIDEPEVVAGAAQEVGIDPGWLEQRMGERAVEEALRADAAAAREPSDSALALDHKLADDAEDGRRLTCPSYEIVRAEDGEQLDLPGFQPIEAYEAAIANLAPELERRADPESVEEVLEWAGEPLASAEVAKVCGLDPLEARERLAAVAEETPVGADGYWRVRG
jgi:predicted DsbA family dithiol-disulfide isomerase